MNKKLPNNYDDWKQSPHESEVYAECIECWDKIYKGEEVYRTIDGLVHIDCYDKYAKKSLNAQLVIAGEED